MSPSDEEEADEARVRSALGSFIPTTGDEVERAEAEGVAFEGELPSAIAAYRPRSETRETARLGGDVVSLSTARRSAAATPREPRSSAWITHVFAASLGAAAAVTALYAASRLGRDFVATGEGPRPAPSSSAASAPPRAPIPILTDATCEADCCGGELCAAHRHACPSGRSCVACAVDELGDNAYRLRVGGLVPNGLGAKALKNGPIEVCVRVATSEAECKVAGTNNRWLSVPTSTTAGTTVGGVTIDIRYRGAKEAFATWSGALAITSGMLCKGTIVEPLMQGGDSVGALSVFLDDTTFVELGRAADVSALAERKAAYEPESVLSIYETKETGSRRFALVIGPFSARRAERARWSVLDHGGEAELTTGDDFRGEPRPSAP